MKKNTLLSIAALLALGLAGTSCKNNEDNPTVVSNTTKLTATLNGASEKPTSTTSTATGTFSGELNTIHAGVELYGYLLGINSHTQGTCTV